MLAGMRRCVGFGGGSGRGRVRQTQAEPGRFAEERRRSRLQRSATDDRDLWRLGRALPAPDRRRRGAAGVRSRADGRRRRAERAAGGTRRRTPEEGRAAAADAGVAGQRQLSQRAENRGWPAPMRWSLAWRQCVPAGCFADAAFGADAQQAWRDAKIRQGRIRKPRRARRSISRFRCAACRRRSTR